MNIRVFSVLLFLVCGTLQIQARKVRLIARHQINKRQADPGQEGTVAPRRSFVSPNGQPYYEYQPPISSGYTGSHGRSATSQVNVGNRVSQPVYEGVRRGQTYRYPFGRERIQYQAQTSNGRSSDGNGESGSANPITAQPTQSNRNVEEEHIRQYELELRRRQEELKRRQEEDRRRQEEENRVQEEERRLLEEERRKLFYDQQRVNQQRTQGTTDSTTPSSRIPQRRVQEEERRLLEEERRRHYYDQQRVNQQRTHGTTESTTASSRTLERRVQEEERRLLEEERRRHYYDQQRVNQQRTHGATESTTASSRTLERRVQEEERRRHFYEQQRAGQHRTEGTADSQQSTTPNGRTVEPGNSQQQPVHTAYTRERVASGSPSNQQNVYRRQNYQSAAGQTGSYSPSNQQPSYRPAPQQNGYIPQYQSPVHNTGGRATGYQYPLVYGGTGTTYQQGSQPVPHGRTQFYPYGYRQNYPGFRTYYEYPGQGLNNPSSSDAVSGYYAVYNPHQNGYSECPETGIDLRINSMDCQQAIQHFGTYLCYAHEYTSKQCCEVCRPSKQPSRIGCEYGDHAEICSSITPADCYDLRNRQSCCDTCERLRRPNASPGCEYGDMTVRCENVRQNPGLCYIPDNQRLCCEACNQIRNSSNPGCPWGDYNTGLCQIWEESSASVRINCYSPQRQRLCCHSCERLREWLPDDLPPDCQYGDRPVIFTTSQYGRLNCTSILSHFGVEECRTNPAVMQNCCYTCHRYSQSRG